MSLGLWNALSLVSEEEEGGNVAHNSESDQMDLRREL